MLFVLGIGVLRAPDLQHGVQGTLEHVQLGLVSQAAGVGGILVGGSTADVVRIPSKAAQETGLSLTISQSLEEKRKKRNYRSSEVFLSSFKQRRHPPLASRERERKISTEFDVFPSKVCRMIFISLFLFALSSISTDSVYCILLFHFAM